MRPDLFIVALRSTVHTHKHTHSILSIPGNGAKQLFFNRLPVSKCIAMHSACCLNTLSHIAQEHHPTIQPTSQPPIRHHKGAKKQGIKFELDKFITSNFICFFSSLSLVVLLRFAWYRSVSDTINQFISVCLRCRYRVHITTSPHCRTVIRIQIKFFFSIFCFFCFHKCLSIWKIFIATMTRWFFFSLCALHTLGLICCCYRLSVPHVLLFSLALSASWLLLLFPHVVGVRNAFHVRFSVCIFFFFLQKCTTRNLRLSSSSISKGKKYIYERKPATKGEENKYMQFVQTESSHGEDKRMLNSNEVKRMCSYWYMLSIHSDRYNWLISHFASHLLGRGYTASHFSSAAGFAGGWLYWDCR